MRPDSGRPTAPDPAGAVDQHVARLQRLRRPQPLQRRHLGLAAAADGARLPVQAAGRGPAGHRRSTRPTADGGPRRLPAAEPPVALGRVGRLARLGAAVPRSGPSARATRSTSSPTPTSRTIPNCSERTRRYGLYLSIGHDEYWSAPMRDTVEGFIAGGGNAAFLSGNTVVLAGAPRGPDGRRQGPAATMVGYKGYFKRRPGVRHRPTGRAHQHLVRPPHRAAREPHDRRELLPRRLPPHRQAGHQRRRRLHDPPARPLALRGHRPRLRRRARRRRRRSSATSATAATSPTATACRTRPAATARRPTSRSSAPHRPPTSPATTASRPPAPHEPSEVEFIASRLFGTRDPAAVERISHGHAVLGTYVSPRRRHGRHVRAAPTGPTASPAATPRSSRSPATSSTASRNSHPNPKCAGICALGARISAFFGFRLRRG